jgi:hypothetical protein
MIVLLTKFEFCFIYYDHVFLGVGKIRFTQFVPNLKLHLALKVVLGKISFTLNNFKDHI